MRISDWSSDVCSSDLRRGRRAARGGTAPPAPRDRLGAWNIGRCRKMRLVHQPGFLHRDAGPGTGDPRRLCRRRTRLSGTRLVDAASLRSEEHTSELQSLMRISYAVFCLKKKTYIHNLTTNPQH